MKKIVVFTYEFTYSPFSGNGILARSLVKSLLGLGCTVTVWCCRPPQEEYGTNNLSGDNHLTQPEISEDSMERLELVSNIVSGSAWRRVDDQSCWRDFTMSNLLLLNAEMARRLNTAILDADALCIIDWSGAFAYRSILQQQSIDAKGVVSKFNLYLNFRVFSLGVNDLKAQKFYDEMELKAMKNANVVVSLSSRDSHHLSTILLKDEEKTAINQKSRIPVEIVLPPLRQDMEIFAKGRNNPKDYLLYLPDCIRSQIEMRRTSIDATVSNRLFIDRPIIACVARLSPEKCIQRFVKFIEMATDVLEELNLTVVLAGAASDIHYARKTRERLLKAYPSTIIIDRFLSSKELGAVFAHTSLNFHPSFYDAYGMTIVEAAAFGATSVLAGPSVGAFRLLGDDGCLRVAMDDTNENTFSKFSLETIVNFLRESQKNETFWNQISTVARAKAIAWDERSYGERMLQIIDNTAR